MEEVEIRPARRQDAAAIAGLLRAAFDGDAEARLVDRLREDGDTACSLAAWLGDEIVGCIVFSRLPIETEGGEIPAVALGPMAVRPDLQRRGIGARLVRHGLEDCRDRGAKAAVVLGWPDYYPRFGFSAALAKGIASPYAEHGASYMAAELAGGALAGTAGTARYPAAFAEL